MQHHSSLSPAFFLQVGYMNDGTILAADITYYSNGGCTLDESSFVCWFLRLKQEKLKCFRCINDQSLELWARLP